MTESKTAAVVCAGGIGDGLLMMVASHRLQHAGFHVTTYHNKLHELAEWFPDHTFASMPEDIKETFTKYTLVILQNDNTPRARTLIDLYRVGTLRNLSVFYPTYETGKHAPLTSWDRVFDPKESMVSNIATSIASLLQSKERSTNNGIVPKETLKHRRYLYRVVIHPTSSAQKDMWHKARFFACAHHLKKRGFEVVFAVSSQERPDWIDVETSGFHLPKFNTLDDLASFVYESGYVIGNDSLIGHLASNMHIPTLIISNDAKRMQLWRPGWLKGTIVTPSRLIPNFKGSRLREKRWREWITPRKVLKHFTSIVKQDNILL